MGAWGTGLYQDDIADETYTCEILAAALYFQDGYIYWCDKTADDAQDAGPFESILIARNDYAGGRPHSPWGRWNTASRPWQGREVPR